MFEVLLTIWTQLKTLLKIRDLSIPVSKDEQENLIRNWTGRTGSKMYDRFTLDSGERDSAMEIILNGESHALQDRCKEIYQILFNQNIILINYFCADKVRT